MRETADTIRGRLMRNELGIAILDLALGFAVALAIAGGAAYIVLDSARENSQSPELSPAQTRYIQAIGTQQANAYIVAVATQEAAAAFSVHPADPAPVQPAPPTRTAQVTVVADATPPPVQPTKPVNVPPTPPSPSSTPLPAPATSEPPPAELRFTAERVSSAVLTHLSMFVSGNYYDAAPTHCNLGQFDSVVAMWAVACVVRTSRVEDPRSVVVFVEDETGWTVCTKGCEFYPTCIPTSNGCELQYPVSP